MSEKKTAEIKLRIEPSVKAQWQQSAADESTELSPYIVKAVTEYEKNKRTGGIRKFITTNDVLALPVPEGTACINGDAEAGDVIRHLPTGETFTVTSVPANTDEKKFGSTWKPWDKA